MRLALFPCECDVACGGGAGASGVTGKGRGAIEGVKAVSPPRIRLNLWKAVKTAHMVFISLSEKHRDLPEVLFIKKTESHSPPLAGDR